MSSVNLTIVISSLLLVLAFPYTMAVNLPMHSRSTSHHRHLTDHRHRSISRGGTILSDLRPSFAAPVTKPTNLILPGTSVYATLHVPSTCTIQAPCQVLIEAWYDDDMLQRDRTPDLFLLAGNGTMPDPFPANPTGRVADVEAYITRRHYHYIILPSVTAAELWHVRLLNNGDAVYNAANATLRVSAVPYRSPLQCPRGLEYSPCSGRGDCVHGACACRDGFAGRYCETAVRSLPDDSFEVPADEMRMFKYVAPLSGYVAAELKIEDMRTKTLVSQPILVFKRLGETERSILRNGAPLPTIHDVSFSDARAIGMRRTTQRVVAGNVLEGETIYLGVFNFRQPAPAWLARRHSNARPSSSLPRRAVRVSLRVYPCVNDELTASDLPVCPLHAVGWRQSVSTFVVPVLFAAFIFVAIVVLTDGDQQQDDQHDSEKNKLSPDDIEAMYRTFPFKKEEAEALSAVGDGFCTICLGEFEDGDSLRRLHCAHSYHASCIENWLTLHPTCPHCRRSARLNVVLPGRPRPRRTAWVHSLALMISSVLTLGTRWRMQELEGNVGDAGVRGPVVRSDDDREGLENLDSA